MDLEKLEIKLDSYNDSEVHLDNMSIEALQSFLSVTNALKNIAESVSSNISFTIKKGSAYTSANGTSRDIRCIYGKIEEAIAGNSEDEIITTNLRVIQGEVQKQAYGYQMWISKKKFDDNIRNAKKITKKRSRNQYITKFAVLSGKFNAVGGNEPNYHFDYGSGKRTTVECSISQAIELKDHLYNTISCLVQKKFVENDDENITYTHCSVINNDRLNVFNSFLSVINESDDLFKRLEAIYDFADNSSSRVDDLAVLLKTYKIMFSDLNELKTLLILTKNFKDNPAIVRYRIALLKDFNSVMNTLGYV